jgi:hypothetical protein
MKKMVLIMVIALAAAFAFTACDNGNGGTHNSRTNTYTGTVGGVTYTLTIDGCSCVGLTPRLGDDYTLTVGGKTSAGVVTSFKGWVFTLEPFNAIIPFTVTVSGTFITAMLGTITWSDDTAQLAPAGPWVIGPSPHTHEGGAWQYNATQHWRACAICGEEYGRANHTGSTCTVCGYSSGGPSLPNSSILTEYGLSGLSVPAGATLRQWTVGPAGGNYTLIIRFTGSSAHDSAITSCFTSNGWTVAQTVESNGGIDYRYTKDGFEQGIYKRDRTGLCEIYSIKSGGGIEWSYYSGYLTEYGLSGLSVPAGVTDIAWSLDTSYPSEASLIIQFRPGSSAYDSAITSCFTSNGWNLMLSNVSNPNDIEYRYIKTGFSLGNYKRNTDNCSIIVSKPR